LLKEFADRGVAVIAYPLHTSHLFQVLNLLLFGRLKATQKYIPRADADPTDTDHPLKIFKAYELVTTSTTVRASWKKAGFEYCKLDDTFQLLVNDGKIRDSPEFAEIWRMNFLLEWLSTRRTAQKWGLTNRQFFAVSVARLPDQREGKELTRMCRQVDIPMTAMDVVLEELLKLDNNPKRATGFQLMPL
jgi:hypothetical protein